MKRIISDCIKDSINNFNTLLLDDELHHSLKLIVESSITAFKSGRKMFLCGNGGSASDAQHIAAELSGRFYKDREPLYAEALHVNSSYITAVSNDYGYDKIYSRMVEAGGKRGDILIGISTSGSSDNVVEALKKAQEIGMITVGFTGKKASLMDDFCDMIIKVPSEDTPRIQEMHIHIGHIMCYLIEKNMF
tara:strand:+ start:75 stop:647 length:573 start_codon:yes stop_codon:yes gene_type:complete